MTATRDNVALAVFACTEVTSSPVNRRIDEHKTGEHVYFDGGLYLFLADPARWGSFKAGERYELRAAAEPETWRPVAEDVECLTCHGRRRMPDPSQPMWVGKTVPCRCRS